MIDLRTYRDKFSPKVKPQEINSQFDYLINCCKLDLQVWLPTIEMNLQRDFVWDELQCEQFILSILLKRNIPRMAIVVTHDDVYQVIDGKQRLTAVAGFMNNHFEINIEGKKYLYKHLPEEFCRAISKFHVPYYVVHEMFEGEVTDQDKIQWFNFINYSGTPMDQLHINRLLQKLK